MRTTPFCREGHGVWDGLPEAPDASAQLVLLFGSGARLADPAVEARLREAFPRAIVCGCSTAGEIHDVEILDESVCGAAIEFEHSQVRLGRADVVAGDDGRAAGAAVADQLAGPGLRHVLVFSDGLHVNGSSLTEGLRSVLPADVVVTGGLSADGPRFARTVVFADALGRENVVCGVGLYGDRLRIGYGSLGGWDPFGPERVITSSKGNELFELDGRSALSLYKEYLGQHAEGLPATGLLFPLSLRDPAEPSAPGVVRTLLSVHEERGSMTFAGDIPQGQHAQLMKANFERLIEGAETAAVRARGGGADPELALLISCVGRRLVLEQRTEEELEIVREVVGPRATMTGFYSYGEICPFVEGAGCELHNQTMTITTISEV